MSKTIHIKAGLVALLVGAAVVAHQTYSYRPTPIGFILGLLFFGILNVLFSPLVGVGVGRDCRACISRVSAWCGGPPGSHGRPRAHALRRSGHSYVRNPMQLSAVALLFLLGLVLRNVWVSAAGVMAHLYSVGLAGWDENEDLRQRFGEGWTDYRRHVRQWVPSLRPGIVSIMGRRISLSRKVATCAATSRDGSIGATRGALPLFPPNRIRRAR